MVVSSPSGTASATDDTAAGSTPAAAVHRDIEAQDAPVAPDGHFDLTAFCRQLVSTTEQLPELDLVWRNLEVDGVGAGSRHGATALSMLYTPFSPHAVRSALHPPVNTILHANSGTLAAGEMLLVLGRPGSGCTTFMKNLASYREGYKAIRGEIRYGGLNSKTITGPLRGEVVYAGEDDIHFPTLTVRNTLDFVAQSRTPDTTARPAFGQTTSTRSEYSARLRGAIATTLGLTKTYDTKVGNEAIRGISGGEKKRVSIAEVLALHARVQLLDNPSRGLDSSTAAEVARALKTMSRETKVPTVASMYQAGEPLFAEFDKVAVLNSGYMVYYGPADKAVEYFEQQGFERLPHQTSADFLVAVTDPVARKVRKGCENEVSRSPADMAERFVNSPLGLQTAQAVETRMNQVDAMTTEDSDRLIRLIRESQSKHAHNKSPYLASMPRQIWLCTRRRYHVKVNDVPTMIGPNFAAIIMSLIIGSNFYNMPSDSSGFFSRGGVLFFSLLFNAFIAQAEITISYSQRPIVIRQHRFAVARPSADAFANVLLDIPLRVLTISVFLIILYFMTGLYRDAGTFFICWATIILVVTIMVNMFRALASIFRSDAVATMVSGLLLMDFALYAGYALPRPSMKVWWRWLSYCNPVSFAFEIVLSNEMRHLDVPCAAYVPGGPAYVNVPLQYKTCTAAGINSDTGLVSGLAYLKATSDYEWTHAHRNAGILLGFLFFFVILYAVATEFQLDPSVQGGVMVFRRGAKDTKSIKELEAERVRANAEDLNREKTKEDQHRPTIDVSNDVFAWSHVNYKVPVKGQEMRHLLSDVTGFVQPGKLTALMGESGAGKTTLLNVLSQRTEGLGVVSGDFMINGWPLPESFQQQTGYCQQQDTHMSTTTVREALQFSAILRQPATVPEKKKLEYVEEVIRMMEMEPFAEALVGSVGQGLSVEQRKRLTIAVELTAKPKLLLFLDEPTSGMDSLAAWSVVRFLRRLADAGQSILCTIHQPSGELFAQFDRLILLQKGGKVAYQGELHNDRTCGKLLDYFEEHAGAKCPADANPAEFMLDCIGAGASAESTHDWSELYRNSQLYTDTENCVKKIFERHCDPQYRPSDESLRHGTYANGYRTQLRELYKRTFYYHYRTPSYIASKLGLALIASLFISSSFWGQGKERSMRSFQNKLFGVFIGSVLATTSTQQLSTHYIYVRSLFETRENPSRMYSSAMMITAFLLVESPWNILAGTIFYGPWQGMIMFGGGSSEQAFRWFWYSVLFTMWYTTFGLAIQNVAPNAMLGSLIFAIFFSFCMQFCGVLQPPAIMPYFWRSWMFHLTPFRYYIEATMSSVVLPIDVKCAQSELATITPPPGQTCAEYLADFTSYFESPTPHGQGYYVDQPDGTCGYCQYRKGTDYLVSLQADAAHRFRDIGIFISYIAFNTILCYVAYAWRSWNPKAAASRRQAREEFQRHVVELDPGVTSVLGSPAESADVSKKTSHVPPLT